MGYINCSHCGRTLTDDAAFCPICGTPVARDAAGQVPESDSVIPEPVAPVEPALPTESIESVEPVVSAESVEPAAPVDDAAPAAPVFPVEPAAPVSSPYGVPVAPSGYPAQPGQGGAFPASPYGAPPAPQQPQQPPAPQPQQPPVPQPQQPPIPQLQQPQQPTNPYGAPVGGPYALPQPTQGMPAGQPPYGAPQQPGGVPQQPDGMPPYGAAPGPSGMPPYGGMPQQPIPYAQMNNDGKGRGKATASLVLGIISIVLGSLLFGIIAIVLSSQYTKKFGPDGRAKAGKICGIIGSVISAILIVFILVISCTAADISDINVEDTAAPVTSFESGTVDAETEAATEAAQAGLDRLKNPDDTMIQAMAAEADAEFKSWFDYSLTDIGVDPTELVKWSVGTLQCELDTDGVYVDGADAEAFADTSCITINALIDSVGEQVDAFNQSEGGVASDEEAKAKLAEFLENAKTQATPEEYFLCFELDKKGDSWVVEEESFLEEAEYVYSVYDIF
ncbi:zinc-ribbon domain-containing protein [Adlercreutzia sp. ZJ138]|uniref:zinc-ribbon domain-containing protein n=1 Tax=Adlercreutzia sp. ZJ138 TaxID=2709405 RepID=UPI0013ED121C|nr:zinc-ribbon domain-containing protein [Adlercreutzia sp. ZJ138]